MADRCFSVRKTGLGLVRVMKTCGMMGEVIRKAASICIKNDVSPREASTQYLKLFLLLMNKPGNERS